MKANNQQQVWNKIAKPWSKYRNYPIREVSKFLENKKGKLLDLGCGSGRNIDVEIINKNLLEYYGVDFSENMIELAKKKAKELGIKARLFCSNAEKLEFDDEFFDNAIFISTLHCIEGEKAREKSLRELFRVLKNGGEAMISIWNKDSEIKVGKLEAKEGFVNWKNDGEVYQRYYYFYDKDELIYILKEIGFEIIDTKVCDDEEGKHPKKNIVIYVQKSADFGSSQKPKE
jgi:ubiquinone/menaquinone biosynthesis C-methylase UbiE